MILYVVRYHPALTETFVRDEACALHEAGVAVELAAFDPRDPVDLPLPFPVHARPHRWGWLAALPGLFLEWLRRPAILPPRILWLARLARRARRLHVHFAGEGAEWARLAARRAGVPYSVTVHAVDLYKPRPALVDVLRDASAVIAMTEFNRARLARLGTRATLARFGVVGGAPPPRREQNSKDPVILLSVGRNVPKKGFDLLVDAARRLQRPARVLVYSDLAAREGVEILPLAPHAEILEAMSQARAFVLACREAPDGDMDGLPVVLVEAMSRGTPVISTSVSGIPELVDDSVGWIVPPNDPEALLLAMQEAVDDPALAQQKGERARARVEQMGFTREALVTTLRRVLGV